MKISLSGSPNDQLLVDRATTDLPIYLPAEWGLFNNKRGYSDTTATVLKRFSKFRGAFNGFTLLELVRGD